MNKDISIVIERVVITTMKYEIEMSVYESFNRFTDDEIETLLEYKSDKIKSMKGDVLFYEVDAEYRADTTKDKNGKYIGSVLVNNTDESVIQQYSNIKEI